ncbi:MAG: murein L,D-transpeptidase catalytic domain-containing protein [Ginsengibacter sp.]
MRIAGSLLLLIIVLWLLKYLHWEKSPGQAVKIKSSSLISTPLLKDKDFLLKLKHVAKAIRNYADSKNFSDGICFLIDMNIPSGKHRFFIYNMGKDSIEVAGLVTHGSGSDNGDGELSFSNKPGSNCTSLGTYRTGKSYDGKFGLAYKLHGLEESNSKAFERFVVLHAHECVPQKEVHPMVICQSWGCPTVSPGMLQIIKKYIESSEKPILLNIYK